MKKLFTSSLRMSMPNFTEWLLWIQETVSWSWYVLLNLNWGRLTASPIAVRSAEALKPVSPRSVISIDGIASDEESEEFVVDPSRCHDARPSFRMRALKLLVRKSESACWRCVF